MKACVNAFRIQKAGNAASEYEDSFWPLKPCEITLPTRIAVADGATDAVYSGLWANILVRAWGQKRINGDTLSQEIAKKSSVWKRIIRDRQLPWYVEEKARLGTYAALLGLELHHIPGSSAGTWSAIACGDCCLFQIRGKELITRFPVSCADDFSNAPVLLSTNNMNGEDVGAIQAANGTWEEEDIFYLMTDALACWFLRQCESGSVPWQLLSDISFTENPSFSTWVADLRDRQELKNDDCTLVSVSFE